MTQKRPRYEELASRNEETLAHEYGLTTVDSKVRRVSMSETKVRGWNEQKARYQCVVRRKKERGTYGI